MADLSKDARDRYLAVYGAMVALQCQHLTSCGLPVERETMTRIVARARAVAQLSEDVQLEGATP